MKRKTLLLLFILGVIISILNSCEKDKSNTVDNVTLLTNGSSKDWVLSKITLPSGDDPLLPTCILDDIISFNINGYRITNNMSTTIIPGVDVSLNPCKDTIQLADTAYWMLNQKILSISYYSSFYGTTINTISNIIKLTDDSLLISRQDNDQYNIISHYYAK